MREVVEKYKFHHGVPVSLAFCIPFCPWEANALTMGCPQLYMYLSAGWSSGLGFGQVLETEYFLDPLFSTNHPNQNTVYSAISTKSIILKTIQHSHLKGLQTKIGKPYRCDLSSGNEVGRCNRPSLGEREQKLSLGQSLLKSQCSTN